MSLAYCSINGYIPYCIEYWHNNIQLIFYFIAVDGLFDRRSTIDAGLRNIFRFALILWMLFYFYFFIYLKHFSRESSSVRIRAFSPAGYSRAQTFPTRESPAHDYHGNYWRHTSFEFPLKLIHKESINLGDQSPSQSRRALKYRVLINY